MDAYERTLREERWIIAEELLARFRPEPAEVVAFRLLQERDWTRFVESIQGNAALKFFNPELGEFSGAKDWKALSEQYDIAPFDDELAISPDMLPVAQDFCRQLRMEMRWVKDEGCGGCKAFYTPEEWSMNGRGPSVDPGVVLVVCHDGGNMAPRFNLDYEQTAMYDRVDLFLDHRNLWRESQTRTITHVFKKPE